MPPRIMSVFSSDSEAAAPLDAAIGGFFKTLTLENPRYVAKAVDIERTLKPMINWLFGRK